MAGWFKVNRDGERTTIETNRNEIRSDTKEAIEKGREFLDKHERSTSWVEMPGADDVARSVEQRFNQSVTEWNQGVVQSSFVAPEAGQQSHLQHAGQVQPPQPANSWSPQPPHYQPPAHPQSYTR